MRVFVTGAGGFLGSHLAAALQAAGHEVHGSARHTSRLGALPEGRRSVLALGEPFDAALFDGHDALVHCAHDLRPGNEARNVEGTRAWARAARERGVAWQVFVGSYSAHRGARGEYGRAKWTLERSFLEAGHAVVKPGLVIGDGGLFARIAHFATRWRVVPLVDGGRGEVPVVALRDAVTATGAVLERRLPGIHRLYLDERITLRALLDTALAARGVRALRVPLPYAAAVAGVRAVEALGLTAPVGVESLAAFRANQSVADASDLRALVPAPLGLEAMMHEALA